MTFVNKTTAIPEFKIVKSIDSISPESIMYLNESIINDIYKMISKEIDSVRTIDINDNNELYSHYLNQASLLRDVRCYSKVFDSIHMSSITLPNISSLNVGRSNILILPYEKPFYLDISSVVMSVDIMYDNTTRFLVKGHFGLISDVSECKMLHLTQNFYRNKKFGHF